MILYQLFQLLSLYPKMQMKRVKREYCMTVSIQYAHFNKLDIFRLLYKLNKYYLCIVFY